MLKSLFPHVVSLVLVLATVANTACVAGTTLPAPNALRLENTLHSTIINASWEPVPGATSYLVTWNEQSSDFVDKNSTTATETSANINVRKRGIWIVRVSPCNDAGCSASASASISLLQYFGNSEFRVWADFKTRRAGWANYRKMTQLNFYWDRLPGLYLVKYRLSEHPQWTVHGPLSEPGFTLTEGRMQALQGKGSIMVRVYYDCDDDGENCAELGRFPHQEQTQPSPAGR